MAAGINIEPSRDMPAHTAYMAYCRETNTTPSDATRRAFMVGWYDGRIALHLESMQDICNAVSNAKRDRNG